jgi:hypothetical protein
MCCARRAADESECVIGSLRSSWRSLVEEPADALRFAQSGRGIDPTPLNDLAPAGDHLTVVEHEDRHASLPT